MHQKVYHSAPLHARACKGAAGQLRRPFTHILLPLCEKLAAGRGRSAVS